MNIINSLTAPFIAIFLSSSLLGVFALLRNKNVTINRVFCFMCLSIAFWSFGFFATVASKTEGTALFWGKFLYVGATFIPIFFLHFAESLLAAGILRKASLVRDTIFAILFLYLLGRGLLIKGVAPMEPYLFYDMPGQAYPFFILFFFSYVSYAHYKLVRGYRYSTGLKRNQILYVLSASVIGFTGGLLVFVPVYGIVIPPYGGYLVAIFPIILAYSIIQHRLLDINVVIKKSVIYAFASLLLLIPLSILIVVFQKLFFKDSTWLFLIAVFCIMFIAAYFFQLMKVRAERTVESYIFKNKYDYKKTISNLSRAMVSILDIHELCREIITTTTQAMSVNKASVFIFDEEDGGYKMYDSIGLGDTDGINRFAKDNPLFQWVGEQNEIVIREELERYNTGSIALSVTETLKTMGSELCLPLVAKQKLIGIINLGMKGKGEMYTHEDLELLDTMANQATVAIENARLYQDLSRAKVQMQRADRLAALGTLTAGLAHEIRNPLVAIKTFTQLLPTRFDDTEFRDHFLKVTAGEVDRIASLVTELLDFARPSQPKLNSEDLNQVVEKMALLVNTESHKKNIRILKDLYASLPFVTLDREQIKQVLLNILLNAVDATPENGTISVSTRPLTRNGYLGYVQVTIADTGKGISEEDLEKVFTPFYTTKHTGSGLGLSISHQIVQEHQGTIEVESKQNVGTTFRINLPVNPSLMEKGRQRRSGDEKNVSH